MSSKLTEGTIGFQKAKKNMSKRIARLQDIMNHKRKRLDEKKEKETPPLPPLPCIPFVPSLPNDSLDWPHALWDEIVSSHGDVCFDLP